MTKDSKTLPWQDACEIVAGLVLSKRLAVTAVRPDLFMPPYDDIIRSLSDDKQSPIEDIIERVGITPIQSSLDAAKQINGLGSMADWVVLLERSATNYRVGNLLEKASKKMQSGEPVDLSQIKVFLDQSSHGKTGSQPLAEIESSETPYVKSGWKPLDEHLGGIPEVGFIVIAGNPGVGKTTLVAKMAGSFILEHREKKTIIYSLEMISSEIAMRVREVWNIKPDNKDTGAIKDFESRLLINEMILAPEEIINDAARHDKVGLILVDFADLLIEGEVSESKMAHVYRTFMLGAKKLGCTIILLSQLNRNYTGGIPRPYHIRYTSLAEALASMLIMLYNPTKDYFAEGDTDLLPLIDKHAYFIVWKCRGGFRIHKEDSPGAIAIPWNGQRGWGNSGNWYSLKKS